MMARAKMNKGKKPTALYNSGSAGRRRGAHDTSTLIKFARNQSIFRLIFPRKQIADVDSFIKRKHMEIYTSQIKRGDFFSFFHLFKKGEADKMSSGRIAKRRER